MQSDNEFLLDVRPDVQSYHIIKYIDTAYILFFLIRQIYTVKEKET